VGRKGGRPGQPGRRLHQSGLTGHPLLLEQTLDLGAGHASYRVAANNFIADGGDGFTAFVNGAPRTGGKIDLDALIDYFTANPNVGPAPATRSTSTD